MFHIIECDNINYGKYYPYGFATQLWDNNAEDDLNAFNKRQHQKQVAADKRWQKASDKRPLHRKGSLNRV